jgi:hypothetical protein
MSFRNDHSWALLPSANVMGLYNPFAQYIELFRESSRDVLEALSGKSPQAAVRIAPLIAHETRHCADHLGTLWGIRRLVASFEAIWARAQNDPVNFWRIATYRRLVSQDHFADYYSVIHSSQPPSGLPQHWGSQTTGGSRFGVDGKLDESRPIFFTQFQWPDGSPACRVPFSVAALLECNAMHQEWQMELSMLNRLSPADAAVEAGLATARNLSFLYTPEVGKYTTAVHCVANRLGVADALQAFEMASAVATLCLNLPWAMYDRLAIPKDFAVFGKRNQAAIHNRDPGFAFLLLVANGPRRDTAESLADWISALCRASGLPALKDVTTAAEAEAAELVASAHVGDLSSRLTALLKAGRQMSAKMDPLHPAYEAVVHDPPPPLPPIFCNDLKWVVPPDCISGKTPDEIEQYVASSLAMARQFDEFVNACTL